VYVRPIGEGESWHAADEVRRRSKADPYPVFQLYSALIPAEVRRHEGMTFAEWTAAQESLGRTTQYVLEDRGSIQGWLRVAGDGEIGRFDLVAQPVVVESLVETALAKVANRRKAVTIVPEHQVELASQLERFGFEAAGDFTVSARRTVRPIKAQAKVPAVVQTTFG
jgi:hypothetical protein